MQVIYAIVGILAGAASAVAGWLLGAPGWAVAVLYVAMGGLGVVVAALASLLVPLPTWGRRAGAAGGRDSWQGGTGRMQGIMGARAVADPGQPLWAYPSRPPSHPRG